MPKLIEVDEEAFEEAVVIGVVFFKPSDVKSDEIPTIQIVKNGVDHTMGMVTEEQLEVLGKKFELEFRDKE